MEGYLDCSELKVYMDLRKCPITQWEAEKLLEYADPTYNYYITLQQVTNLALHFGIGTQHPLRLTRSEFELALDRSFRGGCRDINNNPVSQSPSNWDLDFQGVVNYFESRVENSLKGSYWTVLTFCMVRRTELWDTRARMTPRKRMKVTRNQ